MESGLPVGSKHQHTECETKSSQACDDTKTGSTSSSYKRALALSPGHESGAVQDREESIKPGISEYIYDQLPDDPRRSYFRVLKVLPTQDPESVVSCTLSTVVLPPLGSKKEHMCLSHRWKPGCRSLQILIDGRTLKVQTDVYQFLKLARERYANVPIWIDTICINQEDVDEKSHQVPLMREIYHQAQVVSYFSGVNPTLEICLKAICQGKSPQHSFDARHRITSDDEGGALLYMLDYLLLYLMHDEYWERAWIIQELLLSGQSVILIGQFEIPWDHLVQYTRLLRESHNHVSLPAPKHFDYSPLATILRHKKEGYGFTPLNLPELLSQFVDVRSHDFHDRIYALLGLAKDRDRVTVDYGSTKEDFFFGNLKSICEKRGINNSMRCLCVCTRIIYAIGLERTFFAPQPQLNYRGWALATSLGVKSHGGFLRNAFSSPGQPYISFEILGRNVEILTPRPHGIDIQLCGVDRRWRWGSLGKNFKSTTIFIQGDSNTWHGKASFIFTEATDRSHWYCSAIFYHLDYESLVEFSEGESAGIWLSVEGPLANSQMRLYLTREAFLGLVPSAMIQSHHVCELVQTYTFVENNEQGYDNREMQSSRLCTKERFDNWLSTKVPTNDGWNDHTDEDGD